MIKDATKHLVTRREFNRVCKWVGLSLPPMSGLVATLSSGPSLGATDSDLSSHEEHTVKFADGVIVPAVGQGSWHLAQGRHPEAVEEDALRTGLSLGMRLIDTAEMYSDGHSESLISRVIAGQRDRVFLVSKVLPDHTSGDGLARACNNTLARLGTDYLDLYLLHWRNRDTDLSRVVAAFEQLRGAGKIRAWGVSNFSTSDMEDLLRVPDGHRCATNQVRYNLDSRRIEYDLLPWCEEHHIPVMAYSPLGGDSLVHDPLLTRIGAAHNCSASAVALAWTIRSGTVIAIPESGSPAHVRENAVALALTLTPQDIETIDAGHPAGSMDYLRSLVARGRRWLNHL
jgi:diketogulonate reductase-like aldo/keto reductase